MKNAELNSLNLRLMTEKARLDLGHLKCLYRGENGQFSPDTVYQHWTGLRGLGPDVRAKYIKIFKDFGLNVTDEDFFSSPTETKTPIKKIPAQKIVLPKAVLEKS